jgi:hypothetical protein
MGLGGVKVKFHCGNGIDSGVGFKVVQFGFGKSAPIRDHHPK